MKRLPLPTVLVKERRKDRQREWKEKTLHGQFLRETEEHENRSRWEWLKGGELKRGTESLICAAQKQALRTKSVAHSIDKTSTFIFHFILTYLSTVTPSIEDCFSGGRA